MWGRFCSGPASHEQSMNVAKKPGGRPVKAKVLADLQLFASKPGLKQRFLQFIYLS